MNPSFHRYSLHRTWILAIAVFFVLYNVAFIGYESFALGRFSILFLVGWSLCDGKNVLRHIRTKAWILFLPFPAVVVQFLLVPDVGQLSRFVYLAYFSFLGASLVALLAKDASIVLRVILIATTIQSVFLFVSFFSPAYRVWFDATVLTGSNYDASYLYRAPGFSSEAGSSLSVIQSFGVFAGWLLLRENEYYPVVKGKAVYIVFFGMAASLLSCIIVGRTGLLLSCLFLLFFLISYGVRRNFLVFGTVCAVIITIGLHNLLSDLLDSGFSIDFFTEWAFGIFTGKDDTVGTLAAMPIPPLTLETFLGTGLQSMVDGTNPSGHDSGMVQAYFSMGLFFALVLYVLYVYVLWHILEWLPVSFRAVLTVVIFGLDVKEPFLFKYSVMFILLSLYFVVRQQRECVSRQMIASVKA